MKCMRDVYYVPFVCAANVLYQLLFYTYENKWLCSLLFMQFAHNSYQLSEAEDASGEI